MNDFNFKIAGEAGYGIASAGLIFAKTALRSGYSVFDFNEYPSLIRGGHNVYGARVAEEEVYSPSFGTDLLIALNQKAVERHTKELSPGAWVILNSDKATAPAPDFSPGINILPIPLIKLAQENGAPEVMMNNVALGAAIFLLGGDFKILESAVHDVFSSAKPEIIDLNIKVARAGFDFAQKNFKKRKILFNLKKKRAGKPLLLTGNDALCLGLIKAGCKFFAAYPMTPINSMIAYWAAKARELNLVYYQPEDEIAGINSALGAAHAGLRACVATSGGGFSLMVEAYGLAGMTETPLVIIEGQRSGPSSGLPTWTGQGDLRFVLGAGQDDFPRVVLAPGDPEECFWQAIEAFNWAEKYQLPVVILVDKYLSESRQTISSLDETRVKIDRGLLFSSTAQSEDYRRYRLTENGISPRAWAGQADLTFFTSSYEHDESGWAEEGIENRKAMMEKRMRKLETLKEEMPPPSIYGPSEAPLGLISWGSNKGAIREAQKILRVQGTETKFLHLNFLNPFPVEAVADFFRRSSKIWLVEQNITGQLAELIRARTGLEIENRILKYDGRPFLPEEIAVKIKEIT
ncbi:MAG: 2-oxoacid:acceptor oxidoreductase subunit alpha [Candidatus Nealsonbacteria bacterium]|nr:2-oxoacid:acceptor oxidoreductase subunit alpha [Candidatus Nealsonbacteria bacterium]